jgi:hypothetical protein
MSLADILTAAIAVIGLALSVYNFYVERRDKYPRLILKLTLESETVDFSNDKIFLKWFVANDYWDKPISIRGLGISTEMGKFRALPIYAEDLRALTKPFELRPGESREFNVSQHWFIVALTQSGAKGRVKIKGAVLDGIKGLHISKESVTLRISKDGKTYDLATSKPWYSRMLRRVK